MQRDAKTPSRAGSEALPDQNNLAVKTTWSQATVNADTVAYSVSTRAHIESGIAAGRAIGQTHSEDLEMTDRSGRQKWWRCILRLRILAQLAYATLATFGLAVALAKRWIAS